MNNKFKAHTRTKNPTGNLRYYVLALGALNMSCSFGQSARSIESRGMVMYMYIYVGIYTNAQNRNVHISVLNGVLWDIWQALYWGMHAFTYIIDGDWRGRWGVNRRIWRRLLAALDYSTVSLHIDSGRPIACRWRCVTGCVWPAAIRLWLCNRLRLPRDI